MKLRHVRGCWAAAVCLAAAVAMPIPGRAADEAGVVVRTLDPKQPWNRTGYRLQEGATYRFTATAKPDALNQPYSDDKVRCTPQGPTGLRGWFFDRLARDPRFFLNPARWMGPGTVKRLRVLQDRNGTRASFLTVIGAIGPDDAQDNVFVIGDGCTYTAHRSGELVLFSNDWPGGPGTEGEARFENSQTYTNNRGLVEVTVERIPTPRGP